MSTISTQIANIEKQINDHLAYIAKQETRYASFLSASNRSCNGIPVVQRAKKQQCEQEKVKNAATASGIKADIDARRATVKNLQADVQALVNTREIEATATATSTVNLSNQGLTPEAVLANTTAQAEAAREVATAQARSIEAGAANKQMVVWAIVIVIAIVVLIFIRKKLA
jgi:cobalamin biosynthesis Mg chelatase CobN